jgi:hypothetical protein
VTATSKDGQTGAAKIGYTVDASPPTHNKPVLSRSQKLAKAIAACEKLKSAHKRAKCTAAAKRRFPAPLTNAQKRAKAIAACKKLKSAHKRAKCIAAAKKL